MGAGAGAAGRAGGAGGGGASAGTDSDFLSESDEDPNEGQLLYFCILCGVFLRVGGGVGLWGRREGVWGGGGGGAGYPVCACP